MRKKQKQDYSKALLELLGVDVSVSAALSIVMVGRQGVTEENYVDYVESFFGREREKDHYVFLLARSRPHIATAERVVSTLEQRGYSISDTKRRSDNRGIPVYLATIERI